jgi:hypothetical protein
VAPNQRSILRRRAQRRRGIQQTSSIRNLCLIVRRRRAGVSVSDWTGPASFVIDTRRRGRNQGRCVAVRVLETDLYWRFSGKGRLT